VKQPLSIIPSAAALCAASASVFAADPTPPSPPGGDPAPVVLAAMAYDEPFFPGANYDAAVPTPDSVLGFRLGDHAVTHAQIEAVIKAIAAKSPRVKLVEYGKTHEGRTLYYVVVSTSERVKDLDKLREINAKLSDPRLAPAAEIDALVKSAPATAWMAYCIHGDEMSGSDASLAVLHHLAAGTGDDVKKLLENLVVIIDPLMNPDGRDRFLSMLAQNRPRQPQVDDQALMHSGFWPSGRMNHYLFDMNRDWIFCTQPETRGRVAAARDWAPHYFMESHEMGSQDTFLFMPPREPVNPNYCPSVMAWVNKFAQRQAAAFDEQGWRYYTGEWNEEWYPGYSSSWAALRGAVENLYEQAGISADGVRRAEGTIVSYRESVHHQLVSSMANLTFLAENREQVLTDFVADRRKVMADDSPYAGRTFAVAPGANKGRFERFADVMRTQGFEMYEAKAAFKADATNRLGLRVKQREFPVGTILIPNRQPLARLLGAMLEFDPRMKGEFLTTERRELLRFGRSKLYDITGWSLPMICDVECCTLADGAPAAAHAEPFHLLTELEMWGPARSPDGTVPVAKSFKPAPFLLVPETTVGFVIDGADDRSLATAARLMERGVWVRCADKSFQFDGLDHPRGSIVITRKDNPQLSASRAGWKPMGAGADASDLARSELCSIIEDTLIRIDVRAVGIKTGLGPGDLPDIGGEHFVLLQPPRVAVLGRDPVGPYSYGQAWYTLDHVLGLRASYVDFQYGVTGADLRRYNVIVIPDGPREQLTDKMPALKSWVEAGGTLIAIGSSAAAIASEKGIGQTRVLDDVLTKPDAYIQAVIREWEGRTQSPDPAAVYAHTPPVQANAEGDDAHPVQYPWDGAAGGSSLSGGGDDKPSDDEIKRRDAWRKIFMPQGALLAARTDDRAWLTGGLGDYVPVMFAGDTVLVSPPGVSAPLRLGVLNPAPQSTNVAVPDPRTEDSRTQDKGDVKTPDTSREPSPKKDPDAKPRKPKPGWSVAPPGQELRLRMSGLLWPEAAERLANTAYVTREQVGQGQVILFASDPNFRAATLGTARVFSNAVVLGPGMGTSQPIKP